MITGAAGWIHGPWKYKFCDRRQSDGVAVSQLAVGG